MVDEDLMLHEGNRTNLQGKRPTLRWILLGTMAPALLWADIAASAAQGLPPGGGPVPPVWRGADGQIEIVPPNAAARPAISRPGAAPVAIAPKAGSPGVGRPGTTPAVRGTGPPQPVITVTPNTPKVPDTTLLGAVVATYSVTMSDGSPFHGTVGFGAPHYDGRGVFALSGNHIIVNPSGPGLGPNKTTITDHITLEAIP
jgi:hypothetical protein